MLNVLLSNPALLCVAVAEIIITLASIFIKSKIGDYLSLLAFLCVPVFVLLAFFYNASFQMILIVVLGFAIADIASLMIRLRRKI